MMLEPTQVHLKLMTFKNNTKLLQSLSLSPPFDYRVKLHEALEREYGWHSKGSPRLSLAMIQKATCMMSCQLQTIMPLRMHTMFHATTKLQCWLFAVVVVVTVVVVVVVVIVVVWLQHVHV